MSELSKKVKLAIERYKAFEPDEGYYICYSGGKDSDVIRILAQLADVKHSLNYNVVSVDAPENVRYIKSIENVNFDYARYPDGRVKTMWNLIPKKMLPPTRIMRYCCAELKEQGGKGKLKVTGVRASESVNRKKNAGMIKIIGKPKTVIKNANEMNAEYKVTPQGGVVMNMDNDENRRLVEHCYRTTSTILNPIIDWTDDEVWEFLKHYGCEGNPLYKCGYTRVGCIGCPMASTKTRIAELNAYPKYRENYIRAFEKMIKRYKEARKDFKKQFTSGEEVMDWWLQIDRSQAVFDGFELEELL